MRLTEEHLAEATRKNGLYMTVSKKQRSMVKKILKKEVPSMRKTRFLVGLEVSDNWWDKFKSFHPDIESIRISQEKKARKVEQMFSKKKAPKRRGRKNKKFKTDEFYLSREWRELRVRVLEEYECKCMMCGRSPKNHGIIIHADHIKPRSKYPELALSFENIQLLCEDCNLGKSNKFTTDYRPTSS